MLIDALLLQALSDLVEGFVDLLYRVDGWPFGKLFPLFEASLVLVDHLPVKALQRAQRASQSAGQLQYGKGNVLSADGADQRQGGEQELVGLAFGHQNAGSSGVIVLLRVEAEKNGGKAEVSVQPLHCLADRLHDVALADVLQRPSGQQRLHSEEDVATFHGRHSCPPAMTLKSARESCWQCLHHVLAWDKRHGGAVPSL